MRFASPSNKRWRATALYRSVAGFVDVEWFFDEIEELHGLIERGPDWNTLIRCTVTLNDVTHPELTLEAAATL